MPSIKFSAFWRLAFWIATTSVTTASLLPGDSLPPLPDVNDKIEHAMAYAALATLGGLGWRLPRTLIAGAIGLILLGAAIELVQTFIPGRHGECADVVANAAGVLLGAAPFALLAIRRRPA